MPNRQWTGIVMAVATFLLIAWDIWAILTDPGDDSISRILLDLGQEHFTLPFVMGTLMGHWFWPREKTLFGLESVDSFLYILLPLGVITATVDLFISFPVWIMPFVPALGYFVGHLLWSQQKKS